MDYESVRKLCDYTFRIHSNIEGLPLVLDRLLASFPEAQASDRTPTYTLWERRTRRAPFVLTLDGGQIQRVEAPGSMVDWLLIDITRKAAASMEGYFPVHAGVVSHQGRAILLPASSGSGKTTTVAGLIRAGFSYLSDEVALIGLTDALVYAFPRPLVMSEDSLDALEGLRTELPIEYESFRGRWFHVAPDDLHVSSPAKVSVPAYVVAPQYTRGAETSLRPMTRAETLFVLAENAFDLDRTGPEGFAMLRALVRRVSGYRLEIGDLPSAIDAVTKVVGTPRLPSVAGA